MEGSFFFPRRGYQESTLCERTAIVNKMIIRVLNVITYSKENLKKAAQIGWILTHKSGGGCFHCHVTREEGIVIEHARLTGERRWFYWADQFSLFFSKSDLKHSKNCLQW